MSSYRYGLDLTRSVALKEEAGRDRERESLSLSLGTHIPLVREGHLQARKIAVSRT